MQQEQDHQTAESPILEVLSCEYRIPHHAAIAHLVVENWLLNLDQLNVYFLHIEDLSQWMIMSLFIGNGIFMRNFEVGFQLAKKSGTPFIQYHAALGIPLSVYNVQ